MEEISRTLRNQGFLYLTCPNMLYPKMRVQLAPCYRQTLSYGSLMKFFNDAGIFVALKNSWVEKRKNPPKIGAKIKRAICVLLRNIGFSDRLLQTLTNPMISHWIFVGKKSNACAHLHI